MDLFEELNQIATAKYGLELKDPIFRVFDRLVQDPRFELVKDVIDDDYAEFDNTMRLYNNNNITVKTIKNILNLIYTLNGRKGYHAKRMTGHTIPKEEHIAYWIDMLGKELIKSSNGDDIEGVDAKGNGIVNGSKIRASIYHILDILKTEDAIYDDNWVADLTSPCCIFGRGIYKFTIFGTESGVGYLNPEDNKYYVNVVLDNIFMRDFTPIQMTIEIGDEPLGEEDFISYDVPNGQNLPYGLYTLKVENFTPDIQAFYIATKDREYVPGRVKEKTGIPPLNIYTVEDQLLDWNIMAVSDGVGKIGKNYLKPRLEAIPNGAAGTWLSYAAGFVNAINGFTVNSGNATRLLFQIRHSNDAAIQPSHVGDIMMVEGSTIPTAYDADITMYKKRIMQGNIVNHDATAARVVGESQELYCGDDGGGGTNNYIISSSNIAIRCKTYSIPVKQNTDYSIRVFNSSYNDIEFYTCYYSEPGTVTPTVTSCSTYTQKSIPGDNTFVTNDEQWIKLVTSHNRNINDYWGPVGTVPCDVRPLTYEYCNYYATLKAGTYKVMIDTWGNNRFWGTGGYWTGIDNYTGCVYDNFNYDQLNSIYEWFSLIEEDDTVIIPKTKLLPDDIGSKMVKIEGATPPLPNYFHKEVEFTIDHDCKIGLIHKAYYYSRSEVYPPYFRFMIVDSDVEAQYFETTGADPAQMQGYSAWEKFKVTLDIHIYPEDRTTQQAVRINLDDLLNEGDVISLTSSGVNIPTYEGWNTIVVDSPIQPLVYVKYQQ